MADSSEWGAGGLKKSLYQRYDHPIIVVGAGPGNPDYMLPAARKAVEHTSVLVAGKRLLDAYTREGQTTFAVTADIDGVLDFIRAKVRYHDVVVLVSGDPGYFSLLDALRRSFPQDMLQVIPGISAMQFAFARLALPWHEARLVSLHGREPREEQLIWRPGAVIGILTDREHTPQRVAAQLFAEGWPPAARLYICERLSYEDETITQTTLGHVSKAPAAVSCILIAEDTQEDVG